MANKRQREARKRYKSANPDLFPPPPQQSQKPKKAKTFKKQSNPNKKFNKHPLRVPGMKPGESCFICKAFDHVAKLCPQKAEWSKNKICLLCRRRGHTVKECSGNSGGVMDKKFCYNCGETGHALRDCTRPLENGGTKYASCFICKEQGHLSKECPQNTHGIYPKGGCCNVCGGVTHLAKDCPNKFKNASTDQSSNTFGDGRRSQVTKLTSGDDLEDDFMIDNTHDTKEKSSAKLEKSKRIGENKKLKNGTKVVNFL